MRNLRLLAFVTAGFAYAVIVLGFVVRVTGSGMGCGDDWPLCNGRLIPAFDSIQVGIEYGHRLAVLGLGGLVVALVASAYRQRTAPGGTGPGGTWGLAGLVVLLLVAQSMLGAVTVWLELPPHTVILHLATGLALLATLIFLGLRAGVHGGTVAPPEALPSGRGGIMGALALGAIVVLMGGMTASTNAAAACMGFPLCNGQLWPTGTEGGLAHIHWTHRLLAYVLFLHLLGIAVALQRRGAPRRVLTAGWISLGLGTAQVAVGAVMILSILPPSWRAIHAALGAAVWVALAYLWWLSGGQPSASD
jgi:heme A synthase